MLGSLALNIAGTVLGAYSNNQQAKAAQAAAKKQYALNLAITRASLDTLNQRANQQSVQINRDKLLQQMAAEKAGIKAIGTNTVTAASLGTTGVRTELAIQQEVMREVGDAQTEADINAQIEQWNLQNQVQDQSQAVINALNNSSGSVAGSASTLQTVVDIGSGILNTYRSFDQYEKADFNSTLSGISSWFK